MTEKNYYQIFLDATAKATLTGMTLFSVHQSTFPDELPLRLINELLTACPANEREIDFKDISEYGGIPRIVMDTSDTTSTISISLLPQLISFDFPADA